MPANLTPADPAGELPVRPVVDVDQDQAAELDMAWSVWVLVGGVDVPGLVLASSPYAVTVRYRLPAGGTAVDTVRPARVTPMQGPPALPAAPASGDALALNPPDPITALHPDLPDPGPRSGGALD